MILELNLLRDLVNYFCSFDKNHTSVGRRKKVFERMKFDYQIKEKHTFQNPMIKIPKNLIDCQ